MNDTDPGYRYLNRDGQWLDFTLEGVERRPDGSLTLASVPVVDGPMPDVPDLLDGAAPAGLAVTPCGIVFYTLPNENTLMRLDPCDPPARAVPCLDLKQPRGLAYHSERHALVVCDTGSGRLLIFDIDTWTLLEARTGFQSPVAVAVDEAGNTYVADTRTKRVRKFTPAGDEDAAFNAALDGSGLIADPGAVAVFEGRLYMLDNSLVDVLVFDAAGKPLKGQDVLWEELDQPCGLAATATSIYVGDNKDRRILRYVNEEGFRYAGEIAKYDGPVAALAIGAAGELVVHTGSSAARLRVTASGYVSNGFITGGPFTPSSLNVPWYNLDADLDHLPEGTHVQLFFYTGNAKPAGGASAFPAPWKAGPPDATDIYIGGDPARSLWVGVRLTGDGSRTPTLRELKATFNQKGYLPYLPAVYRNSARSDFLARFLALCESFNVNTEDAIVRLPELFDPYAIPAEYLGWLATWLAVDLDEHWSAAKQREAIARAYRSYARRGTLSGLREAIAFETGVQVRIEEPLQEAAWWVLPGAADPRGPKAQPEGGCDTDAGSELGVSTALSVSIAQGAVVGSTAILDRSRIIDAEDIGAPLFDETAHRFTVVLPPFTGAGAKAAVKRIVEREKPAHTSYHLCSYEPRMSVGLQARVGIDTIVGGETEPNRLDHDTSEHGIRLGGPERPRVGVHSRIGNGLCL